MAFDDRDFSSPNKQKYPKFQSEYEDAHWRKISDQQQEFKRNLIILGIGVITLVWLFGETLANYWLTFSWPKQQNKNAPHDTTQIIPPKPTTPELQFPESGSIIQYQQSNSTTAKFTVISNKDRTDNCVIKLETWNEGIPTLELFVRAGEQAETQLMPLGDYRVKYACGNRWYGRSEMFGRETQVSIGIQPLKFWKSGNTINGNILTLAKIINGNFKTNDSRFNKF